MATSPAPQSAIFDGRSSEFDVTNQVHVSSVAATRDAVHALMKKIYPHADLDVLWLAFHDFERLFAGRMAGYLGCDTVYHDRQHSLDMTLAMARLIAGHEVSAEKADRFGPRRALMGLITALYHDSGYIRRSEEQAPRNGAEYTAQHVTRSADYLRQYLPRLGLAADVDIATRVVHFTGYEIELSELESAIEDPRDSLVGHLMGTADLIAQMSDRCYLEKCRDRLYSEFVLGGVAIQPDDTGQFRNIAYESGIDLLRKTPDFWRNNVSVRLDEKFNRAYRYMEPLYEGRNPYMMSLALNLEFLGHIIENNEWDALRRRPPCFTALDNAIDSVSALVSRYLAEVKTPL